MAKTPHFFKVKSRIGLTNPPIRHTELNLGVEEAPDSVLPREFLNKFGNVSVDQYEFTPPEKINKNSYWNNISEELEALKEMINNSLKSGETQIVLGGDNTVTLSSLQAAIERVGDPSKIGYIQFDSHGEMHQSQTSLSKNFHGMYMRPFFDVFDIPQIDKLVPKKLKTSQALTIGDIVFDGRDSEEENFYKQNKIRNINLKEFTQNKEAVLSEIEDFTQKFDHLHINFDIDVFHRSISEATGLPEDGRWFKLQIFEILDILSKQTSLSIDMVEINPKKPNSDKTIVLAQEILIKLLS